MAVGADLSALGKIELRSVQMNLHLQGKAE